MSVFNYAGSEPIALLAGAAVTRRTFVKASTAADLTVLPCAAGTDTSIGVAIEAQTAIGSTVVVQSYGIAQVTAGAPIARGVNVTSNASGQAVLAVTGNTVYGISLNAPAALGETCVVLLHGGPNTSGPTTP